MVMVKLQFIFKLRTDHINLNRGNRGQLGFLLILQSLLSHFKATWHNDDDDDDNDLYREDTFDETNDDFDYNCLYKIKNELILYLMMST